MADTILLLALMSLAYGLGAGATAGMLKLSGHPLDASAATWVVLVPPLVVAALAEALTQLWQRTPGTLGTGSLVVVLPMAVAGVAAVAIAATTQALAPAFDPSLPRGNAGLDPRLAAALLATLVALALWRFWPVPTPRLW